MKKLLIIMTLFVSSFFLLSIEDVSAYEYTSNADFSVMDDVLLLKEKLDDFIKNDTQYSDKYIISYNNNVYTYYILPLDESVPELYFNLQLYSNLYIQYKNVYYGTNLDVITFSSSLVNKTFYLGYNEGTKKFRFFYCNFNLYYPSMNTPGTITYTYEDFSYVSNVSEGSKVLTLYDIYLEYQKFKGEDDLLHQEELDTIKTFYNVSVQKLAYLSETIASNYIYLSIIVIFILIFVFLLIFRRFIC